MANAAGAVGSFLTNFSSSFAAGSERRAKRDEQKLKQDELDIRRDELKSKKSQARLENIRKQTKDLPLHQSQPIWDELAKTSKDPVIKEVAKTAASLQADQLDEFGEIQDLFVKANKSGTAEDRAVAIGRFKAWAPTTPNGEQLIATVLNPKQADLAAKMTENIAIARREIFDPNRRVDPNSAEGKNLLARMDDITKQMSSIRRLNVGKETLILKQASAEFKQYTTDLNKLRTGGEGTQKKGVNVTLPSGEVVTSFDGGRSFKDASGAKQLIPQEGSVFASSSDTTEGLRSMQSRKEAKDRGDTSELDAPIDISTDQTRAVQSALKGTGIASNIKAMIDSTAGGVGLDKLFGQKEGFFPENADSRQHLNLIKQLSKSALLNNPRAPVAEQEFITELVIDPKTFFANPVIEARKFPNLLRTAKFLKVGNDKAIENGTPDEIKLLRQNNIELDQLISLLGEKSDTKTNSLFSDKEEALLKQFE